jgi:hypothetical protein
MFIISLFLLVHEDADATVIRIPAKSEFAEWKNRKEQRKKAFEL